LISFNELKEENSRNIQEIERLKKENIESAKLFLEEDVIT
jgi:hypothetical protein